MSDQREAKAYPEDRSEFEEIIDTLAFDLHRNIHDEYTDEFVAGAYMAWLRRSEAVDALKERVRGLGASVIGWQDLSTDEGTARLKAEAERDALRKLLEQCREPVARAMLPDIYDNTVQLRNAEERFTKLRRDIDAALAGKEAK